MIKKNNEDSETSKFMLWLAVISTILFFIYIFCVTFFVIPEKNTQIVNYILGFLSGTLISTIYNYYFGSSNSSKSKDKVIQNMSNSNIKDNDNINNNINDNDIEDNQSEDCEDELKPPIKG